MILRFTWISYGVYFLPLMLQRFARFKGHGMLAPFTAGWQSTDVNPLVIDRSEVLGHGIALPLL
jgi:hypothetical protein